MTDLVVVPHTHWDREWYLPFQRFRLRLVTVLDRLLAQLAEDPRARFTLDGQTAAIEDYLEIRPEQDGLVRELVERGRLAVGPWRVLADSFLCSGENLVRNLEIGMRRADDLGGALMVGYLPDQFGHAAQLPQILRIAGIEHACLWRGVPDAVRTTAFRWVAPDGSAVRCQYLPEGGYGGAAGLFADPDPRAVRRRAAEHVRALRKWQKQGALLGMYGTDHSAPVDDLADIVEAASRLAAWEETVHPHGAPGVVPHSPSGLGEDVADTLRRTLGDAVGTGIGEALDEVGAAAGPAAETTAADDTSTPPRIRLDTLGGYLLGHTLEDCDTAHYGELRSHARADILPGVLSSRIALKQALSRAERRVERYAEPLTALYGMPFATQPFLNLAWLRLVDSSCHDSVTGCGSDETAAQVATRIAEASDLARGVCELVLSPVAATVPDGGHVVFNPSPRHRCEVVRLEVIEGTHLRTADGDPVPVQVLSVEQPVFSDAIVPADELDRFLRRVHGRELYGQQVTAWEADEDAKTLTFRLARASTLSFTKADVLAAVAGARTEYWRVKVLAQARETVAALVGCGPLGLAAVTPSPRLATGVDTPPIAGGRGALSDLDNGLVHVALRTDGLLDILGADRTHVAGLGAIVDGGDLGDEYDYAPPARDRLVTEPQEVWNRVMWSGPLTGCLESVRWYRWPERGDFQEDTRDEATAVTEVTTRIELRHGEPFVRLSVTFDNQADDHRVRLHLPLPRPADRSHAEGQFAVVARGLTAEGGGGETPVPTFPAYGWVAAGGLAVLLDHVSEYELVDEGRTLAVTLLRSVGMLSRNRNAHREVPAGPQLETPGAQCHGPRTVEFGLFLYSGEWHESGLLDAAERFRHPFETAAGWSADGDTGPRVPEGGISVDGPGVVMTSCRDVGTESPEMRLVALHPEATRATISSAQAGGEVPLGPWQVVSVRAR